MAYEKYKVKDNAQGEILGGLTSVATSITIKSGQGAKFPTYGAGEKSIGTLIAYDGDNNITKRERVTITARTGDTVTITRGFGGDTPDSFSDGDYLYIFATSGVTQDIQDELERLEDDKLDSDGQLRTGNGSWKVTYNNGDGDEVELGLGADGTFLKSNGATEAPSFDNATVSDASETVKGVVERATNAEAETGTDTTRYITPKQAKDNYGKSFSSFNADVDFGTSTGTIDYAHGLGKTPALVKIDTSHKSGTFHGTYDGTTNRSVGYLNVNSSNNHTKSTAYISNAGAEVGSGNSKGGAITSMDETNISITRTKFGTPTGTFYINVICYA